MVFYLIVAVIRDFDCACAKKEPLGQTETARHHDDSIHGNGIAAPDYQSKAELFGLPVL
jgi:hypothetical protein